MWFGLKCYIPPPPPPYFVRPIPGTSSVEEDAGSVQVSVNMGAEPSRVVVTTDFRCANWIIVPGQGHVSAFRLFFVRLSSRKADVRVGCFCKDVTCFQEYYL